jgi:hypothetical protein
MKKNNLTCDWEIRTSEGWKSFGGIEEYKNRQAIRVFFEDKNNIVVSPDHEFETADGDFVYAKDSVGRNIKVYDRDNNKNTSSTVVSIKSIKKCKLYDVANVADCRTFYGNNISNHNTHLMKEFWAAVYPIISASKKSKIIIASTPNGTDNLFYQLWSGAERGENGWAPLRIHWSEIPGRDAEWARITKSSLESEDLWAQEFELEFHSAGQSSINYEQLEQFKMRLCEPDLTLDDGAYRIYKSPDPERVYVAGVDIAEGIGQDFSIIEILDITDLQCIEQVAEYAANDISPFNFITKVKEVLSHYGNPLALIERNGPGAQIIDKLVMEEHYDNIVSYGAGKANRKREQHGMISHTNTKYQAIANMRYWMNDLDSLRIYSKECLNEFKHFIRKPNKSWAAEPGFHDDRVMALTWALMILHSDIVERYFEIVELDLNGKPRVIRPLDYGLRYFSNPQSVYTLADNNKESIGMPVVFNDSIEETDINELESLGWELLEPTYHF